MPKFSSTGEGCDEEGMIRDGDASNRLPNLLISIRADKDWNGKTKKKKEEKETQIRHGRVTCVPTAPPQSHVIWRWKDSCLGEDKPRILGLYDGFDGLSSDFI